MVTEFVNPKYMGNEEREQFKLKATRLQSMEYPKLLLDQGDDEVIDVMSPSKQMILQPVKKNIYIIIKKLEFNDTLQQDHSRQRISKYKGEEDKLQQS